MSEKQVLLRIHAAIEKAGSLRKFAASAGLSPAYVSRVLSGDVPPASARLLTAVKVRRVVTVRYQELRG